MEKRYTDSQNKAIQWNDGPVVVLAGPGSGKTAVLTDRIRRILKETADETFRILADIPSIFADYEGILGDKISCDIRKLKEDGNTEEYKENVVKLIQGGKVENAYNLLRIWEERKFSTDEIPEVMRKLIEKV